MKIRKLWVTYEQACEYNCTLINLRLIKTNDYFMGSAKYLLNVVKRNFWNLEFFYILIVCIHKALVLAGMNSSLRL